MNFLNTLLNWFTNWNRILFSNNFLYNYINNLENSKNIFYWIIWTSWYWYLHTSLFISIVWLFLYILFRYIENAYKLWKIILTFIFLWFILWILQYVFFIWRWITPSIYLDILDASLIWTTILLIYFSLNNKNINKKLIKNNFINLNYKYFWKFLLIWLLLTIILNIISNFIISILFFEKYSIFVLLSIFILNILLVKEKKYNLTKIIKINIKWIIWWIILFVIAQLGYLFFVFQMNFYWINWFNFAMWYSNVTTYYSWFTNWYILNNNVCIAELIFWIISWYLNMIFFDYILFYKKKYN